MDKKHTNFLPGIKVLDESVKISKGWGKVQKVVAEITQERKQQQTEDEQ